MHRYMSVRAVQVTHNILGTPSDHSEDEGCGSIPVVYDLYVWSDRTKRSI